MPTPIHHLYAALSSPLRDVAEQLADNLARPVVLQDIAALPAPDTQRPTRQQLRAELGVLREQLDTVVYLLGVGESQPRRYAQEIELLQADRTRIEGLVAGLEQQLAAPARRQEGGLVA
ncbi:hypothetical protein [Hymenobacter sp. BT190]|uniref:hypothetical protein n=1 Tax=Hymenobacter sp. BT190 TaxID=2763505 RepID=UPI00165155C1|nr:hypothetical protein [Hymenobacter sp. BT190]MBC6698897.1 hypothetical protein [Hymenobacter sp. BT190]